MSGDRQNSFSSVANEGPSVNDSLAGQSSSDGNHYSIKVILSEFRVTAKLTGTPFEGIPEFCDFGEAFMLW